MREELKLAKQAVRVLKTDKVQALVSLWVVVDDQGCRTEHIRNLNDWTSYCSRSVQVSGTFSMLHAG